MTNIILTRHLYIKYFVERSMTVSLCKKETDASKYWGYELYFSGFKTDVFLHLLFVYYNFYAYLHPYFEKYMYKQIDNWDKETNDTFLGNIIENLCQKNYCPEFANFKNNEDVWKEYKEYEIISQIKNENCDNDIQKIVVIFQEFIDVLNPIELLSFHNLLEISTILQRMVCSKTQEFYEIMKDIIILKILNIIYLRNNSIKYFDENETENRIELQKEDIVQYKTKPIIYGKGWKIARNHCLYSICREPWPFSSWGDDDDDAFMEELLKKREWYEVYENWLYYASYSPIWIKRINKYGGIVDKENKKIRFPTEEQEDEFYEWFNYEPDEQPKEILGRWFGIQPAN